MLFISQNSAFDPAMFNHHVYIDNGLVAESSLPTGASYAPATPLSPTITTPLPVSSDLGELENEDEDNGTSTSKVPIALPIIAD